MKTEIIKGALPYIREFKGKIFVIKCGGEVLRNMEFMDSLAEEISLLHHVGINIIFVHGGGSQVDEFLERLGMKPRYLNGRRITDEKTLEVAKMVYRGKINLDIVATLRKHGGKPVGLSGVDGGFVKAQKRDKLKNIDFGYVGDIVSIDKEFLDGLLRNDYIPVICSLASDEFGNIYNINADTLAARIAKELKAEKLIIMTDVPGLLKDLDDERSVIQSINVKDIKRMLMNRKITGGMIPKIEACVDAITNGVKNVHIIGTEKYVLLQEVFTNEGSGTMMVK